MQFFRSRAVQIALVLVAIGGVAGLIIWGMGKRGEPRKVTLGIQNSPAMLLCMVAKDEGMFEKHGVDVELVEFTAGKFALQAQLAGSVDYCVAGEVPVCLATMQGHDVRVVAQVVERTVNEVRVVARRDGTEVGGPAAYFKAKKRKLATSFGGGPEFFTYSFLKRYEIPESEVEVLSQKPEDMPASLVAGGVDAVAIFDPMAFLAETKMGAKGVTFSDAALYSEYYVLVVDPKKLESGRDAIKGMIAALADAAEFVEKNPERAKEIVAKYTKLEGPVIEGIWKSFVFKPALTGSLVQTWEAEAEWARQTKKVAADAPTPDFKGKVIDEQFLRAVKPDAILP